MDKALTLPVVVDFDSMVVMKPGEVRLEGGRIEWSIARSWWVPAGSPHDALYALTALATEGDPQAFLDFAERFGILGLDARGNAAAGRWSKPSVANEGEKPTWYFERIESIRAYAMHARAVLAVATALRVASEPIDGGQVLRSVGLDPDLDAIQSVLFEGGIGNHATDWGPTAVQIHPATIASRLTEFRSAEEQRQWLGHEIGHVWLYQAGIVPSLDWGSGPAHIRLLRNAVRGAAPGGTLGVPWWDDMLFSGLALAIAATVATNDHVGQCIRCGKVFYRERRVRTDQPTYCDECRPIARRESNAAAAKRRRTRISSA